MSNEKIVVLCTAKDQEEARQIALALVEENLSACVNILDNVKSIYRWKGKIEEDSEVLMIMKTAGELFDSLVERIKTLHSYEVPEIIALKPAAISSDYEKWWEHALGSLTD